MAEESEVPIDEKHLIILYWIKTIVYSFSIIFAIILLFIFLFGNKQKNFKVIINTQLCIILIISFITTAIPKYNQIGLPESLFYQFLGAIFDQIQTLFFQIITFILLYSYLLLEHIEFIKAHDKCLKILYFSFIWACVPLFTYIEIFVGKMKRNSQGEYVNDSKIFNLVKMTLFLIEVIIQIVSLIKIIKRYNNLSEEEKGTIENKNERKIIYLGISQLFFVILALLLMILVNNFVYALPFLYVTITTEFLSPLFFLFVYAYDEEDFEILRQFCCKNKGKIKSEDINEQQYINLFNQ